MSPLSRTFWLGAGLIVLTNAVVLGGVAYNRSGEPQSRLQLSERELQVERSWWIESKDSSGLALRLDHEVADGWLSTEKLLSLGFTLLREGELETWDERKEIEALVVFELDGPAFQAARTAAQKALAEAQTVAQQQPQDARSQEALESAQRALERFATTETRLYVVDAGLDAAELRRRYPDVSRYAVARAHLRYFVSVWRPERKEYKLSVESAAINIPSQRRAAFEGWSWRGWGQPAHSKVRVDLAFGQRFEPWIIAAERVQ